MIQAERPTSAMVLGEAAEGAVYSYTLWERGMSLEVIPATGCPKGRPIPRHTSVLFGT